MENKPGTAKGLFKSVVRSPWSVVLIFFLLSCSTSFDSKGVYHRVRTGENLTWIAKSYGVDLQDLAELNNIQDPNRKIEPGQKLYIPPRRYFRHKKLPFEEELSKHVRRPPRTRKAERDKIYTDYNRFLWPVRGAVMSPFGIRGGRRHDGIDIKAKSGTPIQAAGDGRVVYAGSMRGYGNLILLRHADNFFTAYAHNSLNAVREKQKIKRGDIIGKVGKTGRASGPHLHFEVREGEKARNPLFFLPVVR
ncbi:MAG: LysM peptidoglycan-binding domain-containing M23 family metallopeptidase [Deltaproteobacteria bacterium]|nr:LysM peptidoglycan-binding domain-containing M23 family metallopeptidase [Deltaproteobacteria bacterium]MBI4224280.1 LysM peptidoglycan-binding domain-containing M23 family metallopeptidase [Deltaproteobacteria bacterium]